MKRKNNKISKSEERTILQCYRGRRSVVTNMAYLEVREVLASDKFKTSGLYDAVLNLDKQLGGLDDNDIVVFSSTQVKSKPGWIELLNQPHHSRYAYFLEKSVYANDLAEIREGFKVFKAALSKSKYQACPWFTPVNPTAETSSVTPTIHKVEVGDVIFWGPRDWILITEIDYANYMEDVGQNLTKIKLKKAHSEKVVITFGASYMSKYRNDSELLYKPAEEFFTAEVLSWMKEYIERVKLGIKAARKKRI